MAVEKFLAPQYSADKKDVRDIAAKFRFLYGKVTSGAVIGDALSTCVFGKLPPGRIRVLPTLSRYTSGIFGASRTFNFGLDAYVMEAGAAVAAVDNEFANAIDVSGALTNQVLATTLKKDFYSVGGIDVIGKCSGGTWPAGITVELLLAYCVE